MQLTLTRRPWSVACLFLSAGLFAQPNDLPVPPAFDSLIQVSRDFTAQADFAAAAVASAAAGELARDCCGERSPAYASYLFNEGRVHDFAGRKLEAVEWYTRSRDLRAAVLGTEHPDYGKSLNNLATVYDEMGRPRLAEPLYLEALAVRKAYAGEKSIPYAAVLDNLAILYENVGRLEEAEQSHLKVMAIREKLLGQDDPAYALSLINLGALYFRTNNWYKAERMFLGAKTILENQEYLDFYAYMAVIDNLGAINQRLGRLDAARDYYEEARALRAEVLGTDNLDYVLSLNHLAGVYAEQDSADVAEALLNESLTILNSIEQAGSVDYALTLKDLARLRRKRKLYSEARIHYRNALEILERHYGKRQYNYLETLRGLAETEIQLSQVDTAAVCLRQLAELESRPFLSALRHFTEEELANYQTDFLVNLNSYFTLARLSPAVADLCYDKLLLYKGLLQNEALQLRQFAAADSSSQATFQQLQTLHRQLSTAYSSSSADEQALLELQEEANRLEKQLIRKMGRDRDFLELPSWRNVRDRLGAGEAAVEFFDYHDKLLPDDAPARYAALVVLAGVERPLFVPLFAEDRLAAILQREERTVAEFVNAFYAHGTAGNELYELIGAPLASVLAAYPEVKTVYYSASGLLHRINFSAIPTPEGRVLGQNYHFLALGSTRSLAYPARDDSETLHERRAVLYGGIDYGTPDENAVSGPVAGSRSLLRTTTYQPRGFSAEEGSWQALPWTEVEIHTARELLVESGYTVELRQNEHADEASFKTLGRKITAPRLLHLATHGFFFPDPEELPDEGEPAFRAAERSMIRSGLVLADGNYAWNHGRPRKNGTEDGILTAYEVSRMHLSGTELVILSACETGLGDIKGTEGVYGLQRAFKIAGARYLIMTLWQVPDFQAQAFMTTFYLAWLTENKTIPEAFRAAQGYMRARYKDAFDWAGFVLIE